MSGNKRMSCTAAFELKDVEFAEKLGNRRAEREHRVSKKLVRDWRKKIELTVLPRSADHMELGAELTPAMLVVCDHMELGESLLLPCWWCGGLYLVYDHMELGAELTPALLVV